MYNFTKRVNRLNDNSIKWQKAKLDPELLPMWIADMDFETFKEMKEAIKSFAEQDIYGYTYPGSGLYESIIDWERQEHNYEIQKEQIVFIDGVVPAIALAIQSFTSIDDAILINSPVYPPFATSVMKNNRKLVRNNLVEVDGEFVIDFQSLEQDIIDNDIRLMIFCSPHNPGGRVWRIDELERLGFLCKKYDVILVVDEIHQDLTLFGNIHKSFNTVNPNFKDIAIILSSATKTFNIAGMKNSFVIIENPDLRKKFIAQQARNNQAEISSLGYIATETAYRTGGEWLRELKPVLEGNINYVIDYFRDNNLRISVMKAQASYLLWLDFSAYNLTDDELENILLNDAKLILNKGLDFGAEGTCHARMNIACPLSEVKEACSRLKNTFENI